MRHVTLLEELEAYRPWNDQEERDRAELLRRLRSGEALYTRDNAAGHLTASAWVVSPDRTQVLMAYHNLYDSWSWLGGHADGDRDLLAVSMREVREETGLEMTRYTYRGIVTFVSEVTSNTALAATMMPVIDAAAGSLHFNPEPILFATVFAASCAFMMPVGTPPNAIVFGTGRIRIGDMVKAGIWLNFIAVIIGVLVSYFLGRGIVPMT